MGRRIPRDLRPYLEEFERRELLSAITDVMAANSIAAAALNSRAAALAASEFVPVDRGSRRIRALCSIPTIRV